LPPSPDFLAEVASQLPQDLRGWCCLIGAGPWAEIYCSWAKQRGGVAVDIGSGFDLLAGTPSRPAHTALGYASRNRFAIVDPKAEAPSEGRVADGVVRKR
jgi:hypothetical protein